ncbi:MAG: helix-turn-helix domain-containing protein [Gammaproteobacteria bacterium]
MSQFEEFPAPPPTPQPGASTDGAVEFEIVDHTSGALRYLEHGYPHPLVRWHFHDEYELHHITATRGKVFVGDYIGEFAPGNLILTGPRLPHNWVSEIAPDEHFPLRDRVIQFERRIVEDSATMIPELRELLPLLDAARHGIEFEGMAGRAEHYMGAIRDSRGAMRMGHFLQFLHELSACPKRRQLSSTRMQVNTNDEGLERINRVVNLVLERYAEAITLDRAADLAGMNPSYFSRFFKKSTGNTFNEFLTRIRISKACEMLSNSDQQITNICYAVGYNNVANFNRRFRRLRSVTPREYRNQAQQRLVRGGETVPPP